MPLTKGAISLVSKNSTQCVLSATAATGGTAPYTYQWYVSTVSGFTPGAGNIISGATSLSLTKSSLIPNGVYYFKVVATDSAGSPATVTYDQLAVTLDSASQPQNLFLQAPLLGMLDLRFNAETVAVEVDASQSTALFAGSAVKIVDSADGIPKVVGCTAASDEVFGFINFDIKSQAFLAGDKCEISQAGNVIYLYASSAIARGAQVQLDVSTQGTITAKVGSSGADIVGYAFDKSSASGSLIRVKLGVPSFAKA